MKSQFCILFYYFISQYSGYFTYLGFYLFFRDFSRHLDMMCSCHRLIRHVVVSSLVFIVIVRYLFVCR